MNKPVTIDIKEFDNRAKEKWELYASGDGPDDKSLIFEVNLKGQYRVTLGGDNTIYKGDNFKLAAENFNEASR